jgi:hypothetical protein
LEKENNKRLLQNGSEEVSWIKKIKASHKSSSCNKIGIIIFYRKSTIRAKSSSSKIQSYRIYIFFNKILINKMIIEKR